MTNLEIQKGFDYLRSIGLSPSISQDGDIRYIPPNFDYSRWIVRYDALEQHFVVITVVRNSPTYPYNFNTYNAVSARNYEELQRMTQQAILMLDEGQKRQADMMKEAKIKEIEKAAERFET